jgi:hypothetical protein
MQLWDTETGVRRHTLKGHFSTICAVAFSRDGKLVASASDDKTVRLWDTETGARRHTLKGHFSTICAVAFSRDGKLFASASHDKTVRLWDTKTGAHLHTLIGQSEKVSAIAFSRDGKRIHTDRGDIALPTPTTPSSSVPLPQPSYNFIQDSWIFVDQQRFLWYPKYQTSCSAVNKDIVCFGHSSGRITLIKLNIGSGEPAQNERLTQDWDALSVFGQGHHKIEICVYWQLREFVRDGLDSPQELQTALTLTGELHGAYACSCEDYINFLSAGDTTVVEFFKVFVNSDFFHSAFVGGGKYPYLVDAKNRGYRC